MFRDLVQSPLLKTLLLTVFFSSVAVESAKAQKEIRALEGAYKAKFRVIREVTEKIRKKEPVNVAQELSIANSMTRDKYDSVLAFEMSGELNDLFQMEAKTLQKESSSISEPVALVALERATRDSQRFL